MRIASILVILTAPIAAVVAQTPRASDAALLIRAIRYGDLKSMEALLSAGVDPNLPNSEGETPLNSAIVEVNQRSAVSLLLNWHADPNKPLDNRVRNGQLPETPLLYAVHSGDLQLISLLLANGARIDTKGPGGRTALHLAVAGGCVDTLQVPTDKAAAGDCLDALQVLLDKGADPNLRDTEGASPLDDAVWRGSADEAAVLLAHGAHLNDADAQTGATPINEAAFRCNAQVVLLLLQFHPDLEIPDNRGHSPLDNAIRMRREDAALLLLDAEPKDRFTAPYLDKITNEAVSMNQARLMEALLGKGVSVNSTLSSGSTPLGAAAFVGAVDVVRLLLARGANPNLSDSDGAAPLWSASLKGYDAIAGTLLDHGAAVNRLNTSSATTALYEAASLGQAKVVKLLLDRGADSTICGNNHKSPYQAALENGYRDVAIQIQNRGSSAGCKQ
jgi:ankyrin repeat protein